MPPLNGYFLNMVSNNYVHNCNQGANGLKECHKRRGARKLLHHYNTTSTVSENVSDNCHIYSLLINKSLRNFSSTKNIYLTVSFILLP